MQGIVRSIFSHPLTRKTRRVLRAAVVSCAVILAVAVVTSVTVDLGPALKAQAEKQGSNFIKRPMHIGRLSVHLWRGQFVFEDFVIEGFTAESRPFLTARRVALSMPWSTLFNKRVVFDAIEMTDWRMYVEMQPDGRHNFPKFTRDSPRGKSAWTTTLAYVHAYRGEFEYNDLGTPWSIVSRNLDVTVARPATEYRGSAKFSNGTIAMQKYVPFTAEMSSAFKIVDGIVRFDYITLNTEGAQTQLTGAVDLGHWPEQRYQMTSKIDFPTQKGIWFAHDNFTVNGTGDFKGSFHLFKEQLPDGRSRLGRELKGSFSSPVAGVDAYRFGDLHGSVLWIPEKLEISDATANVYGGTSRFSFKMEPLNQRGVKSTQTFDASYQNVDLTTFTNALEIDGIRLAGRMSGTNLLIWPSGEFSKHHGNGEVHVAPPEGVQLAVRQATTPAALSVSSAKVFGPFSPNLPTSPVPVGADLTYTFGSEWVDVAPSRIATPTTYAEFQGRTAYGERSDIPFHVNSSDWQDSDRVFAGILTAFGSRTGAIPIGGRGTFDGVMLNSFTRPRIEGDFTGAEMTAWDVDWGTASGNAIIENSYANVKNVVVNKGGSMIYADGLFSLGYPRKDGGEQLDARVRIVGRPIADLRHAFELDDYDVDGLLSGEFHVYGNYQTPLGFGTMSIDTGVAYGEPFETALATLRFDGDGVRLDNIQVVKGGGRGTGAAFVGWNSTYSFNFDVHGIPVEQLALTKGSPFPLSGLVDVTAKGSGTFAAPRYDVHGTIRDLFVKDEGIGQVVGDISINNDLMTLKVEAASPRLAISGAGQIALNPQMDAELSFNISDTSLDPYVRVLEPSLSPYTTAVASGTVRVVGELADFDHLLVDASVDNLDLRLFDYRLRNASPIHVALDRRSVRLAEMRLVGEDTQLDVDGVVGLRDNRVAIRATGNANLGILQGFVANVRSSGRAVLGATIEGTLQDPSIIGTLTVENGRIRHFGLPHALENISGPLSFDSRGVSLDGLTAKLGGGPVTFAGRVDKEGYSLGRIDISMTGKEMRLRFPEGMRSLVDATLTLQGSAEGATLGGDVQVRDAVYSRPFETGGSLLDITGTGGGGSGGSAALEQEIPLRYDVRINAPSTLQVRNNTARLVASADLQLRGTYDRPLLFGRAEVDRGEVLFEGKRYLVTRGTIDFNNPTRIQPFFDLETETRVRVPGETYRVTLRATGTFDRLTLEFTSDPPLPEAQVLALLFSDTVPNPDVELSQYTTGVTPQEQLLRERATRALTGAVSSEVGRVVEQTFGVDTFQLTPSLVDPNTQSTRLDPGARVTIGKRLSDRIYLTYARSLSSTTRDQIILLEYDLSDRFSWILSRNEDRTYALDVRVRHAF